MVKRLKKTPEGWETKWKVRVYQGAAFNPVHSTTRFKACVVHRVRTTALPSTGSFKNCVTVFTVSNSEGQELDSIISRLSALQTGRYILGQHTFQQLLA